MIENFASCAKLIGELLAPSPIDDVLNPIVLVGVAIAGWYLFQIGSRRKEHLKFRIRQFAAALVIYAFAVFVIERQNLPPLQVAGFAFLSAFAALGGVSILVRQPTRSPRIPKRIRRQVIARDLSSKGLRWDGDKHHIDHLVPFSRGGDHSIHNLRVIEKSQNLRKGTKLPGFKDLLH